MTTLSLLDGLARGLGFSSFWDLNTVPQAGLIALLGALVLLLPLFLASWPSLVRSAPVLISKKPPTAENVETATVSIVTVPRIDVTELEQDQSLYNRLQKGLTRTREGFIGRIEALMRGRSEVDQSLLEELEEVLMTADIGVKTVDTLLSTVRVASANGADPSMLKAKLSEEISRILGTVRSSYGSENKPHVVVVVGVNGVGKTTTIGKLAARYKKEGKKVLLAAGDTYRAAAIDQLEAWSERVGVDLIKHQENSDPSAVIHDALMRAKAQGYDIVIADTAGRLHNKKHLMEQVAKLKRTCEKIVENTPHEVLLVLDSTTGQNAIQQAKEFRESIAVTDIVLTKLDGTAKGGVIIGIVNELGIPIKYIGIGEKEEDLREFNPQDFTRALFGEA